MTYRPPRDLDPAARAVIRRKIRTLCRRPHWSAPNDREDLAQELSLHAHRVAGRFDAARGSSSALYERALSNRLSDLRSNANAECRDWRRTVAFEHPDELPLRSARRIDLQLDVRRALTAAPEPLRRLAVELSRDTLVGAARTLGISRQQARHQRQLLAEHFTAFGLDPRVPNN